MLNVGNGTKKFGKIPLNFHICFNNFGRDHPTSLPGFIGANLMCTLSVKGDVVKICCAIFHVSSLAIWCHVNEKEQKCKKKIKK